MALINRMIFFSRSQVHLGWIITHGLCIFGNLVHSYSVKNMTFRGFNVFSNLRKCNFSGLKYYCCKDFLNKRETRKSPEHWCPEHQDKGKNTAHVCFLKQSCRSILTELCMWSYIEQRETIASMLHYLCTEWLSIAQPAHGGSWFTSSYTTPV